MPWVAMIRTASLDDLPGLLDLEQRCFNTDRLSRRSFRHLLQRGHAAILVDDREGALAGYVLVLFRRGVSMARLYSIATHPAYRGQGVAADLVRAAEAVALEEGAAEMRLEVRQDNAASKKLFQALGYRPFGVHAAYYEDAMDAVRYHRYLAPRLAPELARVPFYRQTLDFTCGPASLMMAMKALRPSMRLDRRLELRLWRESTTVFMTSGHGGCGPHGLALAAHHRGFGVRLFLRQPGPMFLDSVRNAEKKEVLRLVQEDFIDEIRTEGLPVTSGAASVVDLEQVIRDGGIPVVLISSYRIYRERAPHWVVVTGVDRHFVYITDPFVDLTDGRTPTDCVNMPITRDAFDRMARYGRSGQQAAVMVYGGRPDNRSAAHD